MSRATAPRTSPTSPAGRLAALVAVGVVLLALLTGNSYALHVGMDQQPASTGAAAGDAERLLAAGGTMSAQARPPHAADPQRSAIPTNMDAQHLMHLVGACLALLVGVVLLLLLSPVPDLNRVVAAGRPAPARSRRTAGWLSAALDPPRSSPVIRT